MDKSRLVSVIIPAYNEKNTIEKLLASKRITAGGLPESLVGEGQAYFAAIFQSVPKEGLCLQWTFNYKIRGTRNFINNHLIQRDFYDPLRNLDIEAETYHFLLCEPENNTPNRKIVAGLRFDGKNRNVEVRKDFHSETKEELTRLLEVELKCEEKIALSLLLIEQMVNFYANIKK